MQVGLRIVLILSCASCLGACGSNTNEAGVKEHALLSAGKYEPAIARLRQHGRARHVGEDGNTLLHEAVFTEHLGVVKALVADGADLNARNHADVRPLDLVASLLMIPGGPSSPRAMEGIGVFLAANGAHSEIWEELYGAKKAIQDEIAAEERRRKREMDEPYSEMNR